MATRSSRITGLLIHSIFKTEEERRSVIEAIEIDSSLLKDPDDRIPYEKHAALWSEAIRRTGNKYIALHVAQGLSMDRLGVLAMACLSCSVSRQALEHFLRYYRISNDSIECKFNTSDKRARISFGLKQPPYVLPRSEAEFILSCVWQGISRGAGKKIFPVETRFSHAEPPELDSYRPVFGDNLSFGCRTNEIVFDEAILDMPMAGADPELHSGLRAETERIFKRLPDADQFIHSIRRAVFAAIGVGELSLPTVARTLNMEPSDLKNQLSRRNTSFRFLVNAIKRDVALIYLEDKTWLISDVAFLLGFSDTSSFSRTFKAWTGETPSEYRRILFESETPSPPI